MRRFLIFLIALAVLLTIPVLSSVLGQEQSRPDKKPLANSKPKAGAAKNPPKGKQSEQPVKPSGTNPPKTVSIPPLQTYSFYTAEVDSSGKVISKPERQAKYFSEDLGNGVKMDMVAIPGGTFLIGTAEADVNQVIKEYSRYGFSESQATTLAKEESPQHSVTISPFYMGKFEVTQAQWRAVTKLPKVNKDLNSDPSNFEGDNLPVERVSWEDAMEFCARLSKKTGRTYGLPSEAQWEYACRAGTTTPFAFGPTITPDLVNYNGDYPYGSAPKGTNRQKTTAVGSLNAANGFGLYDMHGNVWEWCMDVYHDNYNGAPSLRVVRGGAWHSHGNYCRSANLFKYGPGSKDIGTGFRVVIFGARTLP